MNGVLAASLRLGLMQAALHDFWTELFDTKWLNLTPEEQLADRGEGHAFVYFVTDGDLIKIGQAQNPLQRLRQLEIGSGRRLALLALTGGTTALERIFHATYRSLRVRGEWFRYEGILAERLQVGSLKETWGDWLMLRDARGIDKIRLPLLIDELVTTLPEITIRKN